MERKEVPRLFFTKEEQRQIAQAIEEAERKTSAEIFVRIERHCPGNPIERCRELLDGFGLTSTRLRNGVIILITVQDHKAAIFGDTAIDQAIGTQGWHDLIQPLLEGFRKQEPCEALCRTTQSLAERLSTHFPYSSGDVDELPNEPSIQES